MVCGFSTSVDFERAVGLELLPLLDRTRICGVFSQIMKKGTGTAELCL